MIFPIESAWPLRNPGVQAFEVIGRSDHHDAIVAFQAIDLVEEETLDFITDQAVQIFKDEQARRGLAGFDKDLTDGVMWAVAPCEGFHVKCGDRVRAGVQRIHHRFDGDGFSVSR